MRALSEDPKQWETVHALSRSQKEQYPSNVKHDFIDLTGDAKEMAQQLKGVEAEYVFFAAYLQKDTEQENWDVNGTPSQQLMAFCNAHTAQELCSRTSSTLWISLGPRRK